MRSTHQPEPRHRPGPPPIADTGNRIDALLWERMCTLPRALSAAEVFDRPGAGPWQEPARRLLSGRSLAV